MIKQPNKYYSFFVILQWLYLHIGIRVCSGTYYSKNSSSLHTTYRSLLFYNHRLAKTDFSLKIQACKWIWEQLFSVTCQSLQKSSPIKGTSISKGNKDFAQKNPSFYSSGISSCAFCSSREYLLQQLYTLPTAAAYLPMKNLRHRCTLDCSSYIVLHEKQNSCTQKN